MERDGRWLRLCLPLILLGSAPAASDAAPPWTKLALFQHLEADPNEAYRVGEHNGPWMIMACTFSDDRADERAQQLAYELRKQHKLPAYTHEMSFDFSQNVMGRGMNQYGEPKRMRYRLDEEFREIAVLVGDYQTVDDPAAQKVLKKLKLLHPTSLEEIESNRRGAPIDSEGADPDSDTPRELLDGLRRMQRHISSGFLDETRQAFVRNVKRGRGPLGNAFLTTNPVLPREFFVPQGLDRFVVELNQDLPLSLLKCPGQYTVKVATFKGSSVIDPKQIEQVEQGKPLPSRLDEAADRAHRLARALRNQGWEAYEFHDRLSSIVTVGSFVSIGSIHDDGTIEVDPQVQQTIDALRAETPVLPGQAPQSATPKVFDGIPLDLYPVPMEVPRRSISSDYAGPRLGAR